eukprot:11361-Heterococcus_DN1.PRE.1
MCSPAWLAMRGWWQNSSSYMGQQQQQQQRSAAAHMIGLQHECQTEAHQLFTRHRYMTAHKPLIHSCGYLRCPSASRRRVAMALNSGSSASAFSISATISSS